MNPNLQLMLQQAIQYFQRGHYGEADLIFKRILQVDAKNLTSLHLLGLIKASQLNWKEALGYLLSAAKIQPSDAFVQYNLAKVYADSGDNSMAVFHYSKAIAINQSFAEAWSNKGASLVKLKRYDEAIAHLDKALSLKSDFAETWFNKANLLNDLKRYDEAIIHYDKTISLQDDFIEAWANKGAVLNNLKRYDEAITHYNKALTLDKNFAEVWLNKGNTLRLLKCFEKALVHFDRALSLKPNLAEAWLSKGNALSELKRYDEAIVQFDKALSLKPDFAEVWSSKGNALNELKCFDKAIEHLDKALNLNPSIDWVPIDLLHLKMKICRWADVTDSVKVIAKKMMATDKVSQPFPLLALIDEPLLHQQSSKNYIKSKYPFDDTLGPIPRRVKTQKIRIGYFSADFQSHAISALIAELIELHDKDKFEIIAFSFGIDDKSHLRSRLFKAFDQFIDVNHMSDMDIAMLSRELQIDIAVDLGGHTSGARTNILAHRAAPIQVNYLGYPGTLGAEYIDYIVADQVIIPTELQSCYVEKVVYLPNSYQANDRKRLISDKQFTRKQLGLPEEGFVFCCFNNNFKILPATFASWMKILKSVDDSVLWLLQDNHWVVDNLKREAYKHGVEESRLVFAERMDPAEHLARHQKADIFLDTFPYNAHTTGSDALWAGLPILTLMGKTFASRVAASLLNAVGLPEMITSSVEEYESLAIDLALNPNKLSKIKSQLAENRLSLPLFDTPLFAKNIEEAYSKMYERYQENLKPDHIFLV